MKNTIKQEGSGKPKSNIKNKYGKFKEDDDYSEELSQPYEPKVRVRVPKEENKGSANYVHFQERLAGENLPHSQRSKNT